MTVPEFDQALLDKLFPAPSFASAFTSPYAPTPNAGITPDSTATLQRLLKENHQRHHLFFNERGFHNHLTHHLFAAYGIGAPPRVLQEAYDEHASYQRPAYKSPEKVTRDNWKKFLGDEDYYNAYMGFFNEEIEQHGLPSTLERYVFSHEANWSDNEPRMLDRFLAGVLHPMIHFGHAAEFGVPGMAVEGLAQTAVHKVAYQKLFDANFFGSSSTGSYLSTLTSALTLGATSTKAKAHTHAFTILARVLADSRLEAGNPCRFESTQKFTDTLDSVGDIIREYADLWTVDEDKKVIQDRVEELQWFVTTVFGLGGWKKDKPFKADFFLAHLVTSDLFLPSILSLLKPSDQVALMRAYFASCLGYFVSRGRPALDIEGFFEYTSLDPKPPADKTEATEAKTNPWYAVLAHTVPHKDEHHVKAERAMAHGAALYGARPKGWFKDTELKGAEHMDGTLFIRVGGLLMGAMNWQFILGNGGKRVARDETSDVEAGWDRAGLGWAEAWD